MAAFDIESPAALARAAGDRKAGQNKRKRRALLLALATVCALFFALGYAHGYFDGWTDKAAALKESN